MPGDPSSVFRVALSAPWITLWAMLSALSLTWIVVIFVAAAGVIAVAGTYLSRVADELADRTGLGEVIAGALFVGATTSLPGAITSVVGAMAGEPSLAIGNALGGLTAQTSFIAIADLLYRRVNLEHASASVTGLAQGVLFVVLLTIPLLAASEPHLLTIGRIHPATLIIPIGYILGLRLLWQIQKDPMWKPVQTSETAEEISDVEHVEGRMATLWFQFGGLAAVTAVAGFAIAQASLAIIAKTPMTASVVGTLFSAVASSLPELVTAIAAIRIGAVSLAIGNIIGGNAFDVMFLAAADVAYDGPIYAELGGQDRTTALIAMTMTGILLLGMLRRERHGPAGIGFESVGVLALYVFSVVMVAT